MGVNKQTTTNIRQPTSKQANKQKIETNKQTNKHPNKQTNGKLKQKRKKSRESKRAYVSLFNRLGDALFSATCLN
jgi:hypothetical protein